MIFNIRLCQYTISTLMTLVSLIKIRFCHVGKFLFQVLLFIDVPFHLFTSGSLRMPFSYLAKDVFACIIIIIVNFIYNAPVPIPVLQKLAPSTVQLHISGSVHS